MYSDLDFLRRTIRRAPNEAAAHAEIHAPRHALILHHTVQSPVAGISGVVRTAFISKSHVQRAWGLLCLLYTSDAADE